MFMGLRADFGISEFEGMWIELVWFGGVRIEGEMRLEVYRSEVR